MEEETRVEKSTSRNGSPQHNLIADWQTRCGFMEAMVSRLLEHADRKSSHFVPTWQDIHVMESLSKVLSRVAERNY